MRRALVIALAAALLLIPPPTAPQAQSIAFLPLHPRDIYALTRAPSPWAPRPCSAYRVYILPRPDLVYNGGVDVRAPISGTAEARGDTVTIRGPAVTVTLGGLRPLPRLAGSVEAGGRVGRLDPSNPVLWVEVETGDGCVPIYALLTPGAMAGLLESGLAEAELRGTGWAVLRATGGGWWAPVRGRDGYEGRLLFSRALYATGSSRPGAAELYWLTFFQIVEMGSNYDPPAPGAVGWLRGWNTTLLTYIWMPAGYHFLDGSDNPFMAWVYRNRAWATLNPNGPYPHTESAGYWWAREYYFDLGDERVLSRRISYLDGFARAHGYQGFFFDWASGIFLEEPEYRSILGEWRRRHPGTAYQEAVARFYSGLGSTGPWVIVTNQAFRKASYLLGLQDYDMTESYITGSEYYGKRCSLGGREVEIPDTQYYPVSPDELHGSLRDTMYYIWLLNSLAERYAGPRFKGYIYLNYAAPRMRVDATCRLEEPRNAVYYSLAMALIAGHSAYLEVPFNHSLERDPVYFYSLGSPEGNYTRIPGGYMRRYQHGVVIAGLWARPTDIAVKVPPGVAHIYDPYTGRWIQVTGGVARIHVEPVRDDLTGRPAPTGRILLYEYTPGGGDDTGPAPWPKTLQELVALLRELYRLLPLISAQLRA